MTIPINSSQNLWNVFFVQAVSPGQVLRTLERIARAQPDLPVAWLLSSPTQPHGFRALLAQAPHADNVTALTERLNHALQAPVCNLQVSSNMWQGNCLLQANQEPDVQGGERKALKRGLLRLLTAKSRTEPWAEWGRTQGVPVHLLTLEGAIKQGQRVPYRTVAKLDQRSLLVERVNTWYELTLGEV